MRLSFCRRASHFLADIRALAMSPEPGNQPKPKESGPSGMTSSQDLKRELTLLMAQSEKLMEELAVVLSRADTLRSTISKRESPVR